MGKEISLMALIGKKVPAFTLPAVQGNRITTISEKDLLGHYSILFFYPFNFTFVCPTEMHALQARMGSFAQRNVEVYALSVDSVHAHLAWLDKPKEKGGIQGVDYTLLSDLHRDLAVALGVFDEEVGAALRATFLLDKNGVIQHVSINNLGFGRNIDELIRLVDALQFIEEHGDQVCPAGWQKGEKTLRPTQEGVIEYFSNH